MDTTLTLQELGIIVIFALVTAVCIYLLILIHNLNSSAKLLKELLRSNRDNIDKVLKDAPVISKNLAEVSDTAKDEIKVAGSAIKNINETAAIAAGAANTIKKDVLGTVKIAAGMAGVAKGLLFKGKYRI